jgi:hypothetical protein
MTARLAATTVIKSFYTIKLLSCCSAVQHADVMHYTIRLYQVLWLHVFTMCMPHTVGRCQQLESLLDCSQYVVSAYI